MHYAEFLLALFYNTKAKRYKTDSVFPYCTYMFISNQLKTVVQKVEDNQKIQIRIRFFRNFHHNPTSQIMTSF